MHRFASETSFTYSVQTSAGLLVTDFYRLTCVLRIYRHDINLLDAFEYILKSGAQMKSL